YKRDATDRIIERDETTGGTTTVVRYSYTGGGDSPEVTLDANNNVIERILGLPGGVTVTRRGTASTDVWSYPNIHGDNAATTDGNGAKTGGTYTYDPYGNPYNNLPDTAAGNLD